MSEPALFSLHCYDYPLWINENKIWSSPIRTLLTQMQVALMKINKKIILLKCSGQIYPLDVLLIFESTLKQESSYCGGPSRLLGD